MAKPRLDPKAPRRKWKLRQWFLKNGGKREDIPKGFRWQTPRVGAPARTLIKRVQRMAKLPHVSGQFDIDTRRLLFPPKQKLVILHPNYKWSGAPTKRIGPPPGVVWHHAAGTGSPLDIHQGHLRIGDKGIAYHFYVRKDGRIYAGRPEGTMGAHCLGNNDWLGVCAEGNYDVTKVMPPAQLKALKQVHAYLKKKYNKPDRRHRDMPGNATACPGKHFDLAKIVG